MVLKTKAKFKNTLSRSTRITVAARGSPKISSPQVAVLLLIKATTFSSNMIGLKKK